MGNRPTGARDRETSPPAVAVRSRFHWNVGGWFGALIGSASWLLPLAGMLLPQDGLAAMVAFLGFLAILAWAVWLWRTRARRSAFAGLQLGLCGLAVVFAAVITVVRSRVPGLGLPYWTIAVPLTLMGWFWMLERAWLARRGNGEDAA